VHRFLSGYISAVADWLKEASERVFDATPGPWEYVHRDGTDDSGCPLDPLVMFPNGDDTSVLTEADAKFIAHARQDLPRALCALMAADDLEAALRAYLALPSGDGALKMLESIKAYNGCRRGTAR
jgi:hypothetical protein